jgi:serine protease Do
VFVARISRMSAAFKAGIQPGDVIVSFNGTAVEEPSHLNRLISDSKIGTTASISVIHEGKRVDLKVPIERVPRR